MNWHVTPNNDLKPHEESTTCECEPRVIYENGDMLIIHNAFDGRHLFEEIEDYIKKKDATKN